MVATLPAVRRTTSERIEPNYSDQEVEQVIWFASSLALLAGHEIFEMAGRVDLCEVVLAPIVAFGS